MNQNLLAGIPSNLPYELTQVIVRTSDVRIERIVSRGHASPEGFWYDQESNEMVVLISGKAALSFEGRDGVVVLEPGDFVNIKAHIRHRVEWTASGTDTVWLAVHYRT